ncbi:threonine-phosphate decarboxylase CobD [Solimicrobium silvestre]|uniref:threonine-phosphate decarboxylase n=1 Tax=Solimicrobium silvestre TaxID=2099400 RepID=A0A2S9GUZ7_9BURK|nr:threonine-phosphate decarboxylase CobD [Solimicrobium silvestre]PRC91531.1 Threonine-phosphate decarboxylase [Solimicrobium silvestre]
MLEHGGNLNDVIQRFGRARADWLDLSTGLNPHCYPAPELSADVWHRLPETSQELCAAASHYYGAPQMLAVAGTQAAIQALPRLRPPSKVVVAAPSYAEHAHHWGQYGHTLRQVPYTELAGVVCDCDVMVVCNPNNPTGALIEPELLLNWAEQLAARGGWLIVDEAFADTVPQNSVVAWSGQEGLIVLRSVGKFFGLAGLRLGFVAASLPLLRQMEELLGPWAISSAAQQIGCAALRDSAWQGATRLSLTASGKRLNALLLQCGIQANGSALFQWWPEPYAEQFWLHMAERGILVRLFSQAGRGIRLGLPPDEVGWRRLAGALEEWVIRI